MNQPTDTTCPCGEPADLRDSVTGVRLCHNCEVVRNRFLSELDDDEHFNAELRVIERRYHYGRPPTPRA